jgi:transposase, IS30 family
MTHKQLSIEDREKIQELLWEKKSLRYIANILKRSPSTISRELKKNYPKERKVYAPRLAQERALNNVKERGSRDRLINPKIKEYVILKLKERWSPEQIAGSIQKDIAQNISYEAIYQYIYSEINRDGYGYVKKNSEDLRKCLRIKHKRRNRKGLRKGQKMSKIQGVSIDLRPKIVDTRKRFGDWESDTVESCDHKPGINTLLERKSGYCFITKLKNKSSKETADVICKRLGILPQSLRETLTLDNGVENHNFEFIEDTLDLKVYYAHPYSSWERGSNENLNGLIRDYFPKGTDFTLITDEQISFIEMKLNARPRKRFKYKTPEEMFGVALKC